MSAVARRLAHIPPTVFSEMSALAVRTGALNLGQGFPDVDGPPSVIAAAEQALEPGANQYAPGIGVPALRAAIARHQQRHYGLDVDPDREVVVTTGCTEAIAAALLGLVDPGDEVVVLEPYYDSYVAMLDMCGAVRRPVTLRAPDFRLDLDELRARGHRPDEGDPAQHPAQPDRHRAHPRRAAGRRRPRDRARRHRGHRRGLRAPGLRRRALGRGHVPIATLPGMWERTLTLSSAGKTYSFTGWKVGWATGPAPLGAGRAGRQAVAHLHLRLAAAAGGRARARPRARLAAAAGPRPAGPPRPALRRPGRRRARRRGSRRAPTSRPPTSATSAGPTVASSASPCPSGPVSSRSPRRGSTTTPTPAGSSCGGRSARSPT